MPVEQPVDVASDFALIRSVYPPTQFLCRRHWMKLQLGNQSFHGDLIHHRTKPLREVLKPSSHIWKYATRGWS